MKTTTLNKIRSHKPCTEGYQKLLKYLGKTKPDDEPLPFSVIVESNGLYEALWCCRLAPKYDKEWRLFSVWCARQVQHLMNDQRSINALDVAEKYAAGTATLNDLTNARAAARDAAGDAASVAEEDAARAAAWAAEKDAARAAAGAAAWAAWAAAGDAEEDAAWAAAWDAAWDAAWAAAWDAQTKQFLHIVGD